MQLTNFKLSIGDSSTLVTAPANRETQDSWDPSDHGNAESEKARVCKQLRVGMRTSFFGLASFHAIEAIRPRSEQQPLSCAKRWRPAAAHTKFTTSKLSRPYKNVGHGNGRESPESFPFTARSQHPLAITGRRGKRMAKSIRVSTSHCGRSVVARKLHPSSNYPIYWRLATPRHP